jgi:rRNA small subunit pseudouridine methyltransferase Nep1
MLRHPSVKRNAKRRGKKPEEMLLDRSLHHRGMLKLSKSEKRGRPDIIHVCLLEAMGSPLNKQGGLKLWINTIQGITININPETRLPHDYNRFKSLMEQVLIIGQAPPNSKDPLLTRKKQSLKELINDIMPSKVIALTSHGQHSTLDYIGKLLISEENPLVFVGAYPSGQMELETLTLVSEKFRVYKEVLDSWIITSRLIYEFEKNSNIL